jgi:hypothetical protein
MKPFYVLQIQGGMSPEYRDHETYGREEEALKAFETKVAWRTATPQALSTHWRLVERTQKTLAEI